MAAALAIFATVTTLLCAGMLLAAPPRAAAAADPLTVAMDRSLTQLNETPAITVSGDAIAALSAGDTLAVRIEGPATLSQLPESDPALSEAGRFTVVAGSLPGVARLSPSELRLPVPLATLPAAPGAYRIIVEIRSNGSVVATGSTWMGRVAARTAPLDLAFVWRAALGVHRGPDGSFFDAALEQACAPNAAAESSDAAAQTGNPAEETAALPATSGNLPALLALPGKFPDWRFSLGVEPVLLTQLRDMADGYTRTDESGSAVEVSGDDPAAKNVAAVLAGLAGLAQKDAIEVALSAYAGPESGASRHPKLARRFRADPVGQAGTRADHAACGAAFRSLVPGLRPDYGQPRGLWRRVDRPRPRRRRGGRGSQ